MRGRQSVTGVTLLKLDVSAPFSGLQCCRPEKDATFVWSRKCRNRRLRAAQAADFTSGEEEEEEESRERSRIVSDTFHCVCVEGITSYSFFCCVGEKLH